MARKISAIHQEKTQIGHRRIDTGSRNNTNRLFVNTVLLLHIETTSFDTDSLVRERSFGNTLCQKRF